MNDFSQMETVLARGEGHFLDPTETRPNGRVVLDCGLIVDAQEVRGCDDPGLWCPDCSTMMMAAVGEFDNVAAIGSRQLDLSGDYAGFDGFDSKSLANYPKRLPRGRSNGSTQKELHGGWVHRFPIRVAKTSVTDPIQAPLIAEGLRLTFMPGKRNAGLSATWDRDVVADLARLKSEFGATVILNLMSEGEALARGRVENYAGEVEAAGLYYAHYAIPDTKIPTIEGAFEVVAKIQEWRAAGEVVVIHCLGGLGRTGTVAGCVLAHDWAAGQWDSTELDADIAKRLIEARGPQCPENDTQREFIRRFTRCLRLAYKL